MEFVIWILGPLVLSFVALRWYYRHRRQQLAGIAARLGLEFSPYGVVPNELEGFWLTRLGERPIIENCIAGAADGVQVRIFEYRCLFPKAVASHTVVLLTCADLDLPRFLVRPKHRLSILDPYASLAPPPILIREEFNRRWIVAGEETEAVRALFDDELIQFVETNKRWIEADGQRLVLYRWNHTVNHAFLEDFFREAYAALALLHKRCRAELVAAP